MSKICSSPKSGQTALGLVCGLLCLQAPMVPAASFYVSQNSPGSAAPYATWATAATNIQDAIDAAVAGDEIVVTNGVYATGGRVVYGSMTNRVAITKAVVVRSVNGPAVTAIAGYQIPVTIKGDSAVRCVYMTNGAVLVGFTVTNGATRTNSTHNSEINGGGVWCESTSAMVSNCVLVGNACDFAGGGAYQGTLEDCHITGNSAVIHGNGGGGGGGAAYNVLNHCVLSNNVSAGIGGGVHAATLNNCTVLSNRVTAFYYQNGGGASFCQLTNCTIANNFGNGAYRSTLDNCTVIGNHDGIAECAAIRCTLATNAGTAGAVYSTLTNCTLVGNLGGGAFGSTLSNCLITGNIGAAVTNSNVKSTLKNCVILGNGLGVLYADVTNCVIANNRGTGAWLCTLNNCTITGNISESIGGVERCAVNNAIVYHNFSPVAGSENHDSASTFNYSCTTPLPGGGAGNISANPQLGGLAHITAGSPCRGAGSAAYVSGLDIDGELWAAPPSMGCDEYHPDTPPEPLSVGIRAAFASVAAGFEVQFIGEFTGLVTSTRWNFGDGIVIGNGAFAAHGWQVAGDFPVVLTAYNLTYPAGVSATTVVHVVQSPIYYVSAAATTPAAPFTSWTTAATTIQEAVDAAIPGSTVLVTNGVYDQGGRAVLRSANRVAVTKVMTVRSVNGPRNTLIAGERTDLPHADGVRCVFLTNGAVLAGFTLTNGFARFAEDDWDDQENESLDSGGGVWCQSETAVLTNCIFTDNLAHYYGGGVMGGTARNCMFMGNAADAGGGAFGTLLDNCLLSGNSAEDEGGGASASRLNNCTVVANLAYEGGGVYYSRLTNCIVFGNGSPEPLRPLTGSNHSFSILCHCCTVPLPTNGVGNFTNDPAFVGAAAGNFRLRPGSPCIDTGANLNDIIANDLDGNPRPLDGNRDGVPAFDMGAYEFNGLNFTSITAVGNIVRLRWFDTPAGMKLQRTETLTNPSWTEVPISQGQTSIELPIGSSSRQFFRLVNW